jgi:hypothetical protein
MWGLGRGFSSYITEVTNSKDDSDFIRIKAIGSFDHHTDGYWELLINPSLQYVVTSAKFFRDLDTDEPFITISNDGVMAGNGCVVPRTSAITIAGSTRQLSVSDAGFYTDESLFKSVQLLTEATKSPTGTHVIDNRVAPPRSYIVGEFRTKDLAADSSRNPRLSNWWFLFFNASVVIALICIFIFRYRMR